MEEYSNWNYNDFLAFIMVYAAYADLEINEIEKTYIKTQVGDDEFEKMAKYYSNLNDIQRIDIIMNFRNQYCHSDSDIDRVINDIEEVLKKDHNLDAEEEMVFIGIRKLLRSKQL